MNAFRPRVLSLIPPMTQLNTPYPSTAYLTGFLRSRDVDAHQADLALALVLRLLSRPGLDALAEAALALPVHERSAPVNAFLDQVSRYRQTIDRAIAFLQGRDATLAHRIAARELLPEGPRSRTTAAATRWAGLSGRWACRTARDTSPRCT
jgi:hypothetical protein